MCLQASTKPETCFVRQRNGPLVHAQIRQLLRRSRSSFRRKLRSGRRLHAHVRRSANPKTSSTQLADFRTPPPSRQRSSSTSIYFVTTVSTTAARFAKATFETSGLPSRHCNGQESRSPRTSVASNAHAHSW